MQTMIFILTVMLIFLAFLAVVIYFGDSRNSKKIAKITEYEHYPTGKVILGYFFFGGGVGSVLVCSVHFLLSIIGYWTLTMGLSDILWFAWLQDDFFMSNGFSIKDVFGLFFLYLIFGSIFGSVPAVIAGAWLAGKETIIQSNRDFLIIFIKMMLVFMLVGVVMAIGRLEWLVLLIAIGFGLLCAMSAVIVGWFVLPRAIENK